MVFHMKTTLVIDDGVMRRLKQEAARQRCTMSELVEAAIRVFLEDAKKPRAEATPLPCIDAGTPYVDVADRDSLYDVMEKR
jgi:hypothetical protein